MTWFLFVGDLLVMAFMAAVVVWVLLGSSNETIERSAAIPLDDEHRDG